MFLLVKEIDERVNIFEVFFFVEKFEVGEFLLNEKCFYRN